MQRAVLEPEELAEVVAPRGSLVGICRGHQVARPFGLIRDRAMLVADAHPVGRPITPLRRFAEDPIKIVRVDPVGHESRLPVAGRELNAVCGLGRHRSPRSSRSARADR